MKTDNLKKISQISVICYYTHEVSFHMYQSIYQKCHGNAFFAIAHNWMRQAGITWPVNAKWKWRIMIQRRRRKNIFLQVMKGKNITSFVHKKKWNDQKVAVRCVPLTSGINKDFSTRDLLPIGNILQLRPFSGTPPLEMAVMLWKSN